MATEPFIAYHEARAAGGWALLITENFVIDANVGVKKELPALWTEEQAASYRPFTQRIHQAGGKVVAQLYHAGRNTHSGITGVHNVGPSPICDPSNKEVPHPLNRTEIDDIIGKFASAARRAKEAGFDGVELHGAHGYLIAQFLSPFSNKRSDRYGGTLRNRARFALEIVQAVRQSVGPEYPILFRISASEFIPEGMNLQQAKAICVLLEDAGVDAIHVSQSGPATFYYTVPCYYVPPGHFVEFAAELKQALSIPVITVGRITSPELGESILSSHKADFIAMGRASVADPDLPRKLASGQLDHIRSCIGCCQGCLGNTIRKQSLGCLVNPYAGRESLLSSVTTTSTPKQIVVIGGGISGCTVALLSALRGHKVTLLERSAQLGGQWNLAAMPPSKAEFSSFVAWQETMLSTYFVEVRLNTEADAGLIDALHPDIIFDASGSAPLTPPIPGLNTAKWVFAQDILAGTYSPGNQVLVIGGGLVGAETAEYLASHRCKVHLVELQDKIAPDCEPGPRHFLLNQLQSSGVALYPSTKLTSIQQDTIHYETQGSQGILTKIDQVVLAAGLKPSTAVSRHLAHITPTFISIGDAHSVKNAYANIQQSMELIHQLGL